MLFSPNRKKKYLTYNLLIARNKMKPVKNKLGYILRSPYRTAIVKVMDKAYTTTAVWNRAKVKVPTLIRNHCSKNLIAMRRQGIIKCLNPNERFGKVYQLTELGNDLRETIIKEIGG